MPKKTTTTTTTTTTKVMSEPEPGSAELGYYIDGARAGIVTLRNEVLLRRDLDGEPDNAHTRRFRELTAGAVLALNGALSRLGVEPGST